MNRENRNKRVVSILIAILVVTFGTQNIGYAQEAPTITASVEAPLTEATLNESVVTLTLSGGKFARSIFDIRDAVSVSGISGITIPWHDPDKKNDTQITIELEFNGDFDTDAMLTFTVGADAIANYNGPSLTAQLPVTAGIETLVASTERPLNEATLSGSVVTLTLSGGKFARSIFDIRDAVSVSGIQGVSIPWHEPDRKSDTQITIELEFDGNIATDATLTFTVGAGAIANYNGDALTAQVSVSARTDTPVETDPDPQPEPDPQPDPESDPKPTEQTTYTTGDVIPTLPSSGFWFPSRMSRGSYRFSDGVTTITVSAGGAFTYKGITYTSASGVTIEGNRVTSGSVRVATGTQLDPIPKPDDESDYDHIEGPWLWMISPGGNLDKDNLSAASDGLITEQQIAQNGISEGEHFNKLQWTSGRLRPTTVCGIFLCSSDNVINVVREIGLTHSSQLTQYSAYALINIDSPRAQNDVLMGVGSDDSVKVWLNGEVAYRNNTRRRTTGIQNWFRVNLNAGNNLLLIKVCNQGSGGNDDWGMFFKIYLDPEDYTISIPTTETTMEPVPTTDATVSISPASVTSPAIEEQIEFNLKITGGEAIAGYQATVSFDTSALRYISGATGDFLPSDAFLVDPVVEDNLIKLNAVSLAEESNGVGTLATLTFEVIAAKASTLTLSDVLLSNSAGETFIPQIENAEITESIGLKADVNGDGIVNIADLVLVASNLGETGQTAADVNGDGTVNIADLVLVAGALGNGAAAPSLHPNVLEMLTTTEVKQWLFEAQRLGLTDTMSERGILFLQQLLIALTPKKTILLANYPNPFNPETWIPYQLSKSTDVTLTIYDIKGRVIRALDLGHQRAGMYQTRSRAAYWDGRNAVGEKVASGVYFYTLTAGEFTATRQMLIRK